MPYQIERVSACPPPGHPSGTLELIQAIQEGPPYGYAPGEVAPVTAWVPALMRPPAAYMYLATAPDGVAAGFCVTVPLTDYRRLDALTAQLGVDPVDCRYIAELGVASARRREGIARALLQAALGDPQAQAASHLVRTLAGNLPAIRLYRSLGFGQVPGVSQTLHGRPRIFLRRAASVPRTGYRHDAAGTAAVFGRAAASYDRVIPFFGTFAAHLADRAAIHPGDRVLDVACGAGACAAEASRRAGPEGLVVAADLAPPMVARTAAGLCATGCGPSAAVVMDARRLAFASAEFDVVLCGFGMFFFPDPRAVAAEMRRVLRPGGSRMAASTFAGGGRGGYSWFPATVRAAGKDLTARDNPAATADGLRAVLRAGGFSSPVTTRTQARFVFPDTDTYLAWVWSHGGRRVLETMNRGELERFRAASAERLLQHVVPGGYELVQQADLTTASVTSPAGA